MLSSRCSPHVMSKAPAAGHKVPARSLDRDSLTIFNALDIKDRFDFGILRRSLEHFATFAALLMVTSKSVCS